ncbi:hypothetical protein RF11_03741 [Thelohanellus kitauei]|uniref:Protein LAS1 n=1 Tax=Thelohanellus kitauei TaxID=669202 RepID=A0A0C2N7A9_THEKT|nr:hypothetical protein RF11_03741 [Thelohanellus kitauei]
MSRMMHMTDQEFYSLACLLSQNDPPSLHRASQIMKMMMIRHNNYDCYFKATLNICLSLIQFQSIQLVSDDYLLASVMAIARFVTTVTESKTYAEVSNCKESLGGDPLPRWLIEFRHRNIHRNMVLERNIIKCALDYCYKWLLRNYWLKLRPLLQEEEVKKPTGTSNPSNFNKILKGSKNSKKSLQKFITELEGQGMYHQFVGQQLKFIMQSSKPSSWAKTTFKDLRSILPLYFPMVIDYILSNHKFHYWCTRIRASKDWHKCKVNLKRFLVGLYFGTTHSEHESNVIREIIASSEKVINL